MKNKILSFFTVSSLFIRNLLLFVVSGTFFMIVVFSCNQEVDPLEHIGKLSDLISDMDYDPNSMLNVQNIDGGSKKTVLDSVTDKQMEDNNLIVCENVNYNLQQNAEQVAIIRPTHGIIWPGALVKINEGLLDGLPEPVTLTPAPTTLRLDLPGLGEKGTFIVEEPSHSNTQAEIDNALSWWNNNQYQEGYVNPSNSSYSAATSFSSEQLAMDLGLNVKWASGEVSSQFKYTSSSTSKVAMMTFKQVFYTVTLDTPPEPGSVFDKSVDLGKLGSTFDGATVPGYVHTVSYGRIIMFRMTTSESAKSAEVEGAMKYSAGLTKVSADLETKYQSILKNSSIEIITIGGNAEVASHAVTAENFGDLEPILTGENAVYSKNNPGIAIAYTVRFLKDNKVAKMGYTTDYTATECTVSKKGRIRVKCSGWYVLRFYVSYTDLDGIVRSWSSGDITAGNYKVCEIPGGSTNIRVTAKAVAGGNIFTKYYDYPVDACFVTKGTTFFNSYQEVDCNF
ncbi:MAG: thiol-activated cytolysin family protein [Bacteroidota bacterium]